MSSLLNPPLPDGDRRRLRWHQLYGSAAALALAEATRADRRLYVVIADSVHELERLTAELRFFADGALPLLRLPDWEVLPYELFSPHPDTISERLKTLFELPQLNDGCLIVSADTLMQRLPPRSDVEGRAFELKKGQPLAIEPFRQRLAEAGYASVSQVVSPGEFAVRGSLLDVFPMGSATPLRIDLFDDEIEAIRRFDPETQRSLDALPAVQLLPAREVPLDPAAVREFRRRYRTRFEGDPTRSSIYRGVSEGLAPAGIEFYQPLFFDSTATLFDYLPRDAVIVQDAALPATLAKGWQDVEARHEDRRHDIERPVLSPAELFLPPAELEAALGAFASITLDAFKAETELSGGGAAVRNFPTTAPRELRIDVRAEQPFAPLDTFLKGFAGRVLLPLEIGGQPGEFLVLEYLDGDRIYVPVHALHLVSRYTGAAPESAPLHKLGTDQWARARKRAAEQIRDVAAELLDLNARRKAQPGLALAVSELDYQSFAHAFPFEETEDQAQAIEQVREDLKSERPMDRIVCGDG